MLALLAAIAFGNPIHSHTLDALVTIESQDKDNEWSIIGSGSYIKDNRLETRFGILTADHLAEDPTYVGHERACFQDRQCVYLGRMKHGTTGDGISGGDWAVFIVPEQVGHHHLKLGVAPELADRVYSVGYPQMIFRYAEGYVAGDITSGVVPLELTALRGASGSPVIDHHGRVICDVVGYDNTYPFAIELPYPAFSRSYCAIPDLEANPVTSFPLRLTDSSEHLYIDGIDPKRVSSTDESK